MAVTESVLNPCSSEVTVTTMTEHDLLEVVEIEQSCGLSRWGWDAYHTELQSGHRDLMLVARTKAARSKEAVAGYIIARLTAGELHINNVAVRPTYRRARIGTALLGRIMEEAERAGAFAAFLEVRAGNSIAQALYERCGFAIVGRRRNYYSEPREDAVIMSVQLRPTA